MKTSDWITLFSALIAAAAIVISARIALIAVKIQRNQAELERQQAQKDANKDLAEVTQSLAHYVTQVSATALGPDAADALANLNGLVIRGSELADESSDVTWYVYYSLALAYGWLWEIEKANDNFKKALDKADSQHIRIIVLTGEAGFHYSIGSKAEIETGRACFDTAEQALGNSLPDDLSKDQLTQILVQRANSEFNVGNRDPSADILKTAWEQCQEITATWRRNRALQAIVSSFLQTFGNDQTVVPDIIPRELVGYAAEYAASLRQQQAQAAFFAQQSATQPPPSPFQQAKVEQLVSDWNRRHGGVVSRRELAR